MKLPSVTVSLPLADICPCKDIVRLALILALAEPAVLARLSVLPQLCDAQDCPLASMPKLMRPAIAVSVATQVRDSAVTPAHRTFPVNPVETPE